MNELDEMWSLSFMDVRNLKKQAMRCQPMRALFTRF